MSLFLTRTPDGTQSSIDVRTAPDLIDMSSAHEITKLFDE